MLIISATRLVLTIPSSQLEIVLISKIMRYLHFFNSLFHFYSKTSTFRLVLHTSPLMLNVKLRSCKYLFSSLYIDPTGNITPSPPFQTETLYPLVHLVGCNGTKSKSSGYSWLLDILSRSLGLINFHEKLTMHPFDIAGCKHLS